MLATWFRGSVVLTILGLGGGLAAAAGREPPSAQEIEKFKQDGTYEERLERIQSLQQHRLPEGQRERATFKTRRAALEAAGLSEAEAARELTAGPQAAFPFTSRPELRSTGSVRTLTILFDFVDYRAATLMPGVTAASVQENIYGTGTATARTFQPYESVHEYYRRASEDQVDLQGNVLGWYHFPRKREAYQPARAPAGPNRPQRQWLLDRRALFAMLSEALTQFDASHDFAQYDNDHDGDIDLVTMIYAGPNTGWGTFWWAYRAEFGLPEATAHPFDGVQANQFVFQFLETRGPAKNDFDPQTLIHETGHAFGLPDYYDYRSGVGPDGGVGGLDMMDHNWGNHNAFSRWLLDWIKPAIVGTGAPLPRDLLASGQPGAGTKAVVVFPGLTSTAAANQEMFVIENRFRTGNDGDGAEMPNNGLLVWHVDATVNDDETDFAYDNSYTAHKLLRLVRADNARDFKAGEPAGPGTYFVPGKAFTPTSAPSSNGYTGRTGVSLDALSAVGPTMSAAIGILGTPRPAPTAVAASESSPAITDFAGAAQRVETLVQSPDKHAAVSLDEVEAIDRLFGTATAEQLAALWTKLDHKQLTDGHNVQTLLLVQSLLTNWAAKKGEAAMDALLRLPEGTFVVKTYAHVMRSWANSSPVEAAKWYLDEKRAKLRQSRTLTAGKAVARRLFEQTTLAQGEATLPRLESLESTSEVLGAVEGLRRAYRVLKDDEAFRKDLPSSGKHAALIRAYLKAKDAIDDAKQSIPDPDKRKLFLQRLLENDDK